MPPSAGRARLHWLVDAVLAAVGGALFSLPFIHTTQWPAQIALMVLLAWRCGAAGPGRAALLGECFGTAWLCAGTWWLYISMHRYGGLPAVLAGLAVLGLSAFLSLYLAAAMAAAARWRSGRALPDAALFAACWLLAELARALLFTGFPWVASGYAQVDSPLAMLAPWVGVYGIGCVTAFIAALLVPRGRRDWRRFLPAAAGLALLVAIALAGRSEFSRPTRQLTVSLLQTNVAQDEKFSVERMPQALTWLQQQLLAAPGQLVVAPETAIPLLPDQLAPDYWEPLKQRFQRDGTTHVALIGLPLGSFELGYTNSVAGLSPATLRAPDGFYRYDKHHLVPFGEFIPTGFHWFTEMMNIPLGDFNRGPVVAPSFEVFGERVAPNICYEDLFGEELAARFRDPSAAPTIFANLSNIGWFGDSIAIPQHLQISRMRSLEFQRPMLRATNTGPTVVIDHLGQVTKALTPFTLGRLDGVVQGRDGLTPFARWASVAGLWPLVLAALLVVLAAALARRRSQR